MIEARDVQTKGWDTISIIKKEKINKALELNWGKLNPSFNYESEGVSVCGQFSSWSIVDGGGGQLLRIQMPIQSGKLETPEKQFNLDGCTAYIDVSLSLIPEKTSKAVLRTSYQNLALKREDITLDRGGWLLPNKLCPSEQVGVYDQVVLQYICKYFIANPNQFEQIFAEVSFAKSGCPDWAKPKKCAYSYLDSGYLSILSVCSDKDVSRLPLDVDVSGCNMAKSASYILSNQFFLQNIFLTGLTDLYQNCGLGDFYYQNNEYKNIWELRMKSVKAGAINYTPIVYKNKNIIKTENGRVNISFDGKCSLKAGIYMYWGGCVEWGVSLENGVLRLYLSTSGFHHSADTIPWYLVWLSPIVVIIYNVTVSAISNKLTKNIENRIKNIHIANMDCVQWMALAGTLPDSVSISEALILGYQ